SVGLFKGLMARSCIDRAFHSSNTTAWQGGLAPFREPSSPSVWQPTFSLLDQKTHRFVATNIVYLIPQGVRETSSSVSVPKSTAPQDF
ncbi:hypothetical protein AVEN_241893-1, partial [Araneus ventricosus]